MNMWIKATLALGLLSLVACSGLPVSTDYDPSRNLQSLKTFAWLKPNKKLIVDPLVDNDLMDRRIKQSVERQLYQQGYTKANGDEGADFFVSYYVGAEDKLSVSSFRSSFGYAPCWRGCFGSRRGFGFDSDVNVRQYKQGTIMVDIINPSTMELMWRGIAAKRLVGGTPEERDEYVDEIVTAIVEEFPPS